MASRPAEDRPHLHYLSQLGIRGRLDAALPGFAVGLLVGMTGVGGASLMTPLLILLFGVHPATVVGTDPLYAATNKACGSVVHGLGRNINGAVEFEISGGGRSYCLF